MNAIETIAKKPSETFEYLIERGIKWKETFLFFASNGIVYIYYFMRSKGLISIESNVSFFSSIMTIISAGIVYGIIIDFVATKYEK